MSQKKLIALGDFLKKSNDKVELVELKDCIIPIRVKSPSQEDSMKMMELLAQNISEEDLKKYEKGTDISQDASMQKRMEL